MNRYSRLIVMAILVVTLCLIWTPPVAAQVLALGTGVGFPKDVVTVTASFDAKRAKVSALGGDIHFDPDGFSLKGCALGPAVNDKSLGTNLIRPGRERFIVSGFNQTFLPDGVLFTCEFSIRRGAKTSKLTLPSLSAADPRGNIVQLSSKPGRIVVLEASSKLGTSRSCNPSTCSSPIAGCETSHGCNVLSGTAATLCRQDCRRAVLDACNEDEDFRLCR
jgi:hypothetical protein